MPTDTLMFYIHRDIQGKHKHTPDKQKHPTTTSLLSYDNGPHYDSVFFVWSQKWNATHTHTHTNSKAQCG